MDLSSVPFLFVGVLIVASAAMVFLTKRLFHAVIALTAVFIGSALVFLLVGQALLALLQLLVFVGGFSTYLVVAVIAEKKGGSRMLNLPVLVIVSVLLFLALSYALLNAPGTYTLQSNNIAPAAVQAFQGYYATLYLLVILLFAGTIASVLVVKRFIRSVV